MASAGFDAPLKRCDIHTGSAFAPVMLGKSPDRRHNALIWINRGRDHREPGPPSFGLAFGLEFAAPANQIPGKP